MVEDDPDMRDALADVLVEEGFSVHTAADGLEALELLPVLPRPCTVLLDWLMPRLGGAGLLQRLSEKGALEGLRVLVTTYYEGPIAGDGVARVLRKPYDIGELLHWLDPQRFPHAP
nr:MULTISPECIES: response regulator [Myxococcaceae]